MPSYSSRQSLKRKLDNAAYLAKKKELKSVTESLNEFKRQSSLSNYKLCVLCRQYYLTASVTEINNTDPLYGELDLENNNELLRMMKFWICQICQSTGKKIEPLFAKPFMKNIEVEGWNILYPTMDEDVDEDLNVTVDNTLLLIPYTGYNCGNQTHYLVPNLYSNSEVTNSFISTLYHNRRTKFALRKLYADFYDGELANGDNKKLESVSKIHDESCIRSSSSWKQKQKKAIISQFTQFGGAAIAFCLNVGVSTMETVMTSQICNGLVITVEFHGNIHDEFSNNYFYHNHDNTTLCCNTNCVKTKIEEVPEELKTKCLPNFVTSLVQKQTLFVEQFVKNQNFSLFAEEYFCGVNFSLNGSGQIMGLLWTKSCSTFNEHLSQSSLFGSEVNVESYLQYIESSILTTVNHLTIQSVLQVTEDEAQRISSLARKFQIQMYMAEQHIFLPSYETMMRHEPDIEGIFNVTSAKRLLQTFKRLLLLLSPEEKNNISTQDWLESLRSKAKFKVEHDNSKIVVDFEDLNATFYLERRLNEFIDKYGPFIGN